MSGSMYVGLFMLVFMCTIVASTKAELVIMKDLFKKISG